MNELHEETTEIAVPTDGQLAAARELRAHDEMGRSGEQLVNEFAAAFHINAHTAIEMLAWFDANMASDSSAGGESIRERDRSWNGLFNGVFHELRKYCQNQKTAADMLMTLDVMALALGYTSVAGAQGSSDLARRHGVQKQRIDKPLNEFLEKLKLPTLPGQRDSEAREAMSEARVSQMRASAPPQR